SARSEAHRPRARDNAGTAHPNKDSRRGWCPRNRPPTAADWRAAAPGPPWTCLLRVPRVLRGSLLLGCRLDREPIAGDLDVTLVELDAEAAPAERARRHRRGSRAEKGIEDQVARAARQRHAGTHERLRKGGGMGVRGGLGGEFPDRPQVATIGPAHGVGLVKVPLALGQEKQILVASGGAILDALGLAVGLVPHDV